MKITIQKLKKGDVFKFNDYRYKVLRKYINDDKPLKALRLDSLEHQEFHNEELEVEKDA